MIDVLRHPEFIAGKTYTDFIDKHMSERSTDIADFREIAAGLAGLSAVSGMAKASTTARSDSMPTPWQTLGSIQIGDSIHE